MTEPELIQAIKQGDQKAFGFLMKEYGKLVFNTTLNILNSVEDAEDITQEVFINAWNGIKTFKGESKLSTWLYRIAVTKSLEYLRRHKTQKRFAFVISLFQYENPIDVKDKSGTTHPGVKLENKERTQLLFTALEKLPDNQRISFVLNKMEGLSYKEVSEIMKMSESAIESLLFRAKQNLKKLLENYYNQNET